jgi:hypothetical protein
METMKLKMIYTKNKLGHSLSQISELTGLTIDQVKQRLGQATGLSPEVLSNIFDIKQRGQSLELISQEIDVELEVLKQFLPRAIKKTVETHILAEQGPTKTTTPTFLYYCRLETNQLHRVNLITGERSCDEVPNYQFRYGCRWSELPGGSLLFTGGHPRVREVVKIETLREYAVSSQPPMHTPRYLHAAVYHSQYLYVLGGRNSRCLGECESYSCAESRWKVLPVLPKLVMP